MDAGVKSRTYVHVEQVKQHIASTASDMGKNREDGAVEDAQKAR